jgi:hypothetical protein
MVSPRVQAQGGGVTITSPAANAILAAGPDYATDVLGDPWDMSNPEDIAIDPAQKPAWSNLSVNSNGNGLLAGTSASIGTNVALLQRAYYTTLNPGRTGRRYPIDSTRYTKMAFKMSMSAASQTWFPRLFWFHHDLGDPADSGGSLNVIDANQVPFDPGTRILVVDLTQGTGSPWTNGVVKGFSLYPNNQNVSKDFTLDWVRLTTGDANSSATKMNITWTGGSGSIDINVSEAASGVAYKVATVAASSGSFQWNYGVLPPGAYILRVGSTTLNFTVNAPPSIQVIDPDETGGEDFATAVLGNPWDMADAGDFTTNVNIVDHLESRSVGASGFVGRSDGQAVAVTDGGVPVGDPQVYPFSKGRDSETTVIDTNKYHRLTYGLQVHRAYDLFLGSVARVFWGSKSSPSGGGTPYDVTTTKDIIVWPGMNTYTIDLATLTTAATGGLEVPNATPWTVQNVRHLRIDPFEFAEHLTFQIPAVKLAADDATANGRFTIKFAGSDPNGDAATVALYYDTDTNSASGLTLITQGLPLSTAGQFVWNTSGVPAGTYYIFAVASDGRNPMGRYSTGPVRVGNFSAPSNPAMNVDSPLNGASGGASFTIAGWAADLGAAAGTGIDSVAVYADPGTSQQIFLGQAAYGAARGDVGAAFGAQFTNSGFSLAVNGLAAGAHTLAVYGHSSVAGSNTVRTLSYTVAGGPSLAVDEPTNGATCTEPCRIAGWAIDRSAASGTGIDAVHVYAFRNGGGVPIFLGVAQYGLARGDLGAIFGSRFTNAGYALQIRGLAPGSYVLAAYGHSTVTGSFSVANTVAATLRNAPRMAIDGPANGSSPLRPFEINGWAVDLAAGAGPGVDAVHVYAFPLGSTTPQLVGVATYGATRTDVGAAFGGSQFNNSGFRLTVNSATLAAGTYDLAVYAHSTVSGGFDNLQIIRVIVR